MGSAFQNPLIPAFFVRLGIRSRVKAQTKTRPETARDRAAVKGTKPRSRKSPQTGFKIHFSIAMDADAPPRRLIPDFGTSARRRRRGDRRDNDGHIIRLRTNQGESSPSRRFHLYRELFTFEAPRISRGGFAREATRISQKGFASGARPWRRGRCGAWRARLSKIEASDRVAASARRRGACRRSRTGLKRRNQPS